MKVFLNWNGPSGLETVDEFENEHGQSPREFRGYVKKMISEYLLAGMSVYRSPRACKNWRNEP